MIKKIKIKNIVLLLSLLMMTGCDFMDCDESDNFTKQEVLDSYNRVKQLATNVYGFLKADFCSIDGAMLLRMMPSIFTSLPISSGLWMVHGLPIIWWIMYGDIITKEFGQPTSI